MSNQARHQRHQCPEMWRRFGEKVGKNWREQRKSILFDTFPMVRCPQVSYSAFCFATRNDQIPGAALNNQARCEKGSNANAGSSSCEVHLVESLIRRSSNPPDTPLASTLPRWIRAPSQPKLSPRRSRTCKNPPLIGDIAGAGGFN